MPKYLVEFIGTFFLVLTIGLTVIEPGTGQMTPIAISAVLAAMIYAGGPISGAHYNPAITLAFWMRGTCKKDDVPYYVAAQLLAAGLAGVIVLMMKRGATITAGSLDIVPALFSELLFTFALAFVILNVALPKQTAGNSYYGLAIGLLVLGGIYTVGEISGAVFNPAVAVGLVVMGLSRAVDIWLYLVANLLGAALAAVVFGYLYPELEES